jgi:glycosyltransferase involved in cell wall biosynthesis
LRPWRARRSWKSGVGSPGSNKNRCGKVSPPYPHIRYRGPYSRADLPRILAGAAATVIPSDFENCPLVARESLMLRVPVIASRAGGLPEIIHHHQNGLLFPPGDVEALRLHVTRLLRHPDLRARLRRGIAPVKSLPTEARELVGLYRSMTPSLNGVRTAS